ncbi:hypothetical protein THF1D04_40174 [Vibrio owensii]|uniref:Uncharacterized protein n=1 Tax=Vibrio owensii TaxID=696485 RepID=A0AAU9Q8P9_9VIBR|nr:hypothetical protein THF1D04_40174 [Vibrio owensii]
MISAIFSDPAKIDNLVLLENTLIYIKLLITITIKSKGSCFSKLLSLMSGKQKTKHHDIEIIPHLKAS